MPAISVTAPGKTILFGEHAVVYGQPAIAVPVHAIQARVVVEPSILTGQSAIRAQSYGQDEIPLYQLPENDLVRSAVMLLQEHLGHPIPPFILTIHSTVPIAAGLGSSASVAVAVIRGLSIFCGKKLTDDAINAIAFRSESIQHGTPSGIDNSVITYARPVYFVKGDPIQTLQIKQPIHLILADSGERALTKDVVHFVRENMEREPEKHKLIFSRIGEITNHAKTAIEAGDVDMLGKLMVENHQRLKELDVSSQNLDRLVEEALRHGACGAKMCGGGKGGFMVALCEANRQQSIANKLKDLSVQVIETVIGKDK